MQVKTDFLATECAHMTTLSIPEQQTFIAFDLLYNRVHTWCGNFLSFILRQYM